MMNQLMRVCLRFERSGQEVWVTLPRHLVLGVEADRRAESRRALGAPEAARFRRHRPSAETSSAWAA
jgi:hypothetical protein